ncbi:PDR/VanB family oxidoreductase [Dietzia lutea]|uniref:Ferredoxin n=1 Tax=Dietzia lutea TaxID=546160 RepID=A0A2S1R9X4_9ACTN|nr:PDR/VanB family oxidoreductase [Dietzia lutea]AWH93062.1 ferredoxin [Dietzia lutea]
MIRTHDEVELDTVVRSKEVLTDGVVSLLLVRADGESMPAWTPGAHIDIELADGIVRQYSLCGEPDDLSSWRIAILREPESRGGSRFIHDELSAGDRVRVKGPRNHFVLETSCQSILFIAGGIGITPIRTMVEEASRVGLDWNLVYGGRSRSSMAFADELVERHGERVRLLPHDEAGLLPLAELLSDVVPDRLVYCCGPEALISAVEDGVRHWPAGTLRMERFSPRQEEIGEQTSFEIEIGSTGQIVTVDEDTSALDALREAGFDIDVSCTEGVCGTCETGVLSGIPLHLDSVLTDDEREANDTMFPCVSRAKSERLTLNL